MTVTKSKSYAADPSLSRDKEIDQQRRMSQARAIQGESKGITPDPKTGKYLLREIRTVAPELHVIAPFAIATRSAGGIDLPGAELAVADMGIIVGSPDSKKDLLGKVVKFSAAHIMPTNLAGLWPDPYGTAELVCVRNTNIFVVLPDAPVQWVEGGPEAE